MSFSRAFFHFVAMKRDWPPSLLTVSSFTNISKRHHLNSFFFPQRSAMLVSKSFFFNNPFYVLAHHISVARHTAELISLQSPILFFQSLLQLGKSASNSAEAIPRNGLQIPNSQIHEHEGSGLLIFVKKIQVFTCI